MATVADSARDSQPLGASGKEKMLCNPAWQHLLPAKNQSQRLFTKKTKTISN
jgi:hypothetical protein